ncbi:MAG: hypothetical protein HY701_00765 [Gemmatimonadetes bacterium]|nr:hypothetical protein [Gemmatimonadota bacterium]
MCDSFDRDLEQRFRRLRAREQEQAPPFADLVPPREHGAWPRAARWPLAAAAVVALLWLGSRVLDRAQRVEPVESVMRWQAPTDFLLATTTDALLRDLPRFDVSVLDQFLLVNGNANSR